MLFHLRVCKFSVSGSSVQSPLYPAWCFKRMFSWLCSTAFCLAALASPPNTTATGVGIDKELEGGWQLKQKDSG